MGPKWSECGHLTKQNQVGFSTGRWPGTLAAKELERIVRLQWPGGWQRCQSIEFGGSRS